MRRVLVFILLLVGALGMRAQEDPEYKMEIGGSVGLVNYLGGYDYYVEKKQQLIESGSKYRQEYPVSDIWFQSITSANKVFDMIING